MTAVLTGSSSEKNISAVDVFAVPSAPTISTAFRCLCSIRSRNSARVESMVGTSKFEKSRISVFGYSHTGGRHLKDMGTGQEGKKRSEEAFYVTHFIALWP